MKKVSEIKVDTVAVNGKGYDVSVYVFGWDEKWGDITVAYDNDCGKESMFVYTGHINTSDPGEGPLEEFETHDDAFGSEYGWAFDIASVIVDKVTAA